jgi:hypothetical protein
VKPVHWVLLVIVALIPEVAVVTGFVAGVAAFLYTNSKRPPRPPPPTTTIQYIRSPSPVPKVDTGASALPAPAHS